MKALSVQQLTKVYPSGVVAIDRVDLEVAAGDFLALLGPNGAGKTSLIGMVASLLIKTSGAITVFGHSLDREPNAVKSAIGLVPQELNLNQWDKVANIVMHQAGFYGIPSSRARVRTEICLRQLQLWDRRDSVVRGLSGGMKRRLMIARALVHEPRLLILDEPTAGVDVEIRRSMWDFLRELNAQGTTIILTTHYLEEAENLCQKVAIMDKGAIVEQGSMSEVLGTLQKEVLLLTPQQPMLTLPRLPGVDLRLLDSGEIEVTVPRTQSLNGIFSALSVAGVEIRSLRNQSNRLEELFLTLIQPLKTPNGGQASTLVKSP